MLENALLLFALLLLHFYFCTFTFTLKTVLHFYFYHNVSTLTLLLLLGWYGMERRDGNLIRMVFQKSKVENAIPETWLFTTKMV